MVYRRPVAEGQGFAAAGPVDDAVSQKVSDSVHQAQEEQHLDDLAASTRKRREAAQELTGSSAVYNNGSSAASPLQPADSAVSAHLPGASADRAGQQIPLPQEAAVHQFFHHLASLQRALLAGRGLTRRVARGQKQRQLCRCLRRSRSSRARTAHMAGTQGAATRPLGRGLQ